MTTLTRGNYLVEVVADSVGPHGVRIATLRTRYPRFIHAEMLRHRVFSHSVSSSRAIPPEKLIEQVRTSPFVPETFNARVKGMGVGEAIEDQELAREIWLDASKAAAHRAEMLSRLDCDKSRVNRLLEPFLWVTDLITATEWSNFFALRQPDNDDPVPQLDHGAQPEFQIIARMMRDAMLQSEPRELVYGDWHLPYVDPDGLERAGDYEAHSDKDVAGVSAGRCFVSSYDKLDEITGEHPSESYARYERGVGMSHWSPMEHPAQCRRPGEGEKPLRGWKSLRYFHLGQDDAQKLLDRAKSA